MILRPPRSTLFPLHDALPISIVRGDLDLLALRRPTSWKRALGLSVAILIFVDALNAAADPLLHPSREQRSEEHTSELQSRVDLVCRLLLEKKKKTTHRETEK